MASNRQRHAADHAVISSVQTGEEGCLSFPGKAGIVTRPDIVTVKAMDEKGNWYTKTGKDLLARAFCHEIDHLNGDLYIDKVQKWVER